MDEKEDVTAKSVTTSAALRSTIGGTRGGGKPQGEINCLIGKMGYRKQKKMHRKDNIYLICRCKSRKRP